MERRKLFTRMRRPEDAGSSAGEDPEQGLQSPDDGPAEETEPSPEFPPSEVGAEELPAQVAESEKPKSRRNGERALERHVLRRQSLARTPRAQGTRARARATIRDLGGLLLEM